MLPGEIYRHAQFYVDEATGALKPKYFLVLVADPDRDIVARLLTSQPHGRLEAPPCSHDAPYPSFFLGVLGGALGAKSWLDLRRLSDIDSDDVSALLRRGVVTLEGTLETPLLMGILECAAGAPDTTFGQERQMRDALAQLR